MKAFLLATLAALVFAAPATAARDCGAIQRRLETQVVCPVCKPETLDQSNSPIARRMKQFIRESCAAGNSEGGIKQKLVAQFGKEVLAAPEKRGFDLLAWVLPLVGVVVAAAVVGVAAWRWSRARLPAATMDPAQNGRGTIEPELESRLDQELARFD